MIGLALGLVIAVVVSAFGTTSGAHVNPAVSIALAAVRRFPWQDVPAYVVAQLVGGVLGGLLVVGVYGRGATEISGVGSPIVSPGVGYFRGVVAEVLGTFLWLLAVMAVVIDRGVIDQRAPLGQAGLVIGFSVSVAVFVVGPLTGAALNPARMLGSYVPNYLFGGLTPWRESWVYVVGPLVGAVLAAFAYVAVAHPVREVPEEREAAPEMAESPQVDDAQHGRDGEKG